MQNRRHVSQVLADRKVPYHESIAEIVQVPGGPIDDPIFENHLVGQLMVKIQQRFDRIAYLFLDKLRNIVEPGTDLIEILLQALLIVRHVPNPPP
jgi:hypothetical protein